MINTITTQTLFEQNFFLLLDEYESYVELQRPVTLIKFKFNLMNKGSYDELQNLVTSMKFKLSCNRDIPKVVCNYFLAFCNISIVKDCKWFYIGYIL